MSNEIKKPKIHGQVEVLTTAPIYLSRSNEVKAVNLMLPPGISTFYVRRLDKHRIRFEVPISEIQRLVKKSKKLKEAVEGKKEKPKKG